MSDSKSELKSRENADTELSVITNEKTEEPLPDKLTLERILSDVDNHKQVIRGPITETKKEQKKVAQSAVVPTTVTVAPTTVPKPPQNRPAKGREELSAFNLLRVWWTFWIFTFHEQGERHFTFSVQGYDTFMAQGYYGVESFFVLSGFILTFTNLERFKVDSLFMFLYQWFKFFFNRIARLYPVHFIIQCIFYYCQYRCDWDEFMLHVKMAMGWSTAPLECSCISWFVHMEVYLCFFLPIALLLLSRHWTMFFPCAYIAYRMFYVYYIRLGSVMEIIVPNLILRATVYFPIGVLLGFVFSKWRTAHWAFDVSFAYAIWRFCMLFSDPGSIFPSKWEQRLFWLCVIVYSGGRSVVFKFIADNPFIRFMAELSYGIYMVQFIIFRLLPDTFWSNDWMYQHQHPYLVNFYFYFMAVIMSIFFYYCVEERAKTATAKMFVWLEKRLEIGAKREDQKTVK